MSMCLWSIRSRMLPWQGLAAHERLYVYGDSLGSFLLATLCALGVQHAWTALTSFALYYTLWVVLGMSLTLGYNNTLADQANGVSMLTAACLWLTWLGVYHTQF